MQLCQDLQGPANAVLGPIVSQHQSVAAAATAVVATVGTGAGAVANCQSRVSFVGGMWVHEAKNQVLMLVVVVAHGHVHITVPLHHGTQSEPQLVQLAEQGRIQRFRKHVARKVANHARWFDVDGGRFGHSQHVRRDAGKRSRVHGHAVAQHQARVVKIPGLGRRRWRQLLDLHRWDLARVGIGIGARDRDRVGIGSIGGRLAHGAALSRPARWTVLAIHFSVFAPLTLWVFLCAFDLGQGAVVAAFTKFLSWAVRAGRGAILGS